jgi:adenosylhomocysteine nucleosidase
LIRRLALAGLLAIPVAVPRPAGAEIVVLVSANAEWKALARAASDVAGAPSPYGEWFTRRVKAGTSDVPVVFFHGGWGKISAAASTQYAVDRWKPELLVNLGTCGGFRGAIRKGDVLAVDRTVVYDIVEMMGDAAEAIADYATDIDLTWARGEDPVGVRRGLLLSADRDIQAADVPRLAGQYHAVAADWESGAIAWVARANRTPVLILRGVTDLVDETGGEAYGNPQVFEAGSRAVMANLVDQLPAWLARWRAAHPLGR